MNAIGYVRISVKDQSTYSIDGQKRTIETYCASNKLTLLNIFIDDGESSYTFDRPNFKALELFIKQNKGVEYLIILDHDRFSRNLAEALLKIKELENKFGLKVRATSDPFDMDFADPSNFMMRAFKYMMAESELHRIRQRTKAGMVQAALSGRYVARAPWGYINTRDSEGKPMLKILDEKAFVIRMIFKEYNKGKGVEEIRRLVIPFGFDRKGSSVIQEVLGNPLYAGLIRVPAHKGKPETIQRAIHRGIVTEADYWQAQARLHDKKITKQKNEEVPLRGVLRCAECGRVMTAGNSKGRSKYYWYYLCETHKKNLSATKLHGQMNEILDMLSFNEERIEWMTEKLTEGIMHQVNNKSEAVAQTGKALRNVGDKIATAEEKYLVQEDISKATFNKVMSGLRSQQIDLQKRLTELETDQTRYFDMLTELMPKMYDLRGTLEALDLYRYQQFIAMVFDNSLTHDGATYRTAFLHPMFAHNHLVLKEKGLLIIEQPQYKIGKTPISAPDRT